MQRPVPQDQLRRLKELLAVPRKVVIVTHHNPDGDAIGSSLGFRHLLANLGHAAVVVLPNAPPGFLRWMPGYADTIDAETNADKAAAAIAAADLVFALDFNRLDRVQGLQQALSRKQVVLI